MKRRVLKKLTTGERLTLLEQIFAPQGGLEFASCALSDMDYMFDFENANLIEMRWSSDEDELRDVIECTNRLLSPETEQKFKLGMPYFVHAILPKEPITVQTIINWFQNESIAMEHFVTTSDDFTDITMRIALIDREIDNKIANEAFKNKRITNNY
ncbi:MAG: hypothetical protein J5629_05505 [Muribaculaceae bacterium]|nr:hypothetical protein [Muribaculaceae bacterium]